jgi:hypothetical protein
MSAPKWEGFKLGYQNGTLVGLLVVVLAWLIFR